jgi:hypothetical protein
MLALGFPGSGWDIAALMSFLFGVAGTAVFAFLAVAIRVSRRRRPARDCLAGLLVSILPAGSGFAYLLLN